MNSQTLQKYLGSYGTVLFLFVFLALQPIVVLGQNSRGSLRGVVQDSNGGRVANAKIVIRVAESSLRRDSSSDSRREFRLDDLLPGTYQARVSAVGFAEAIADVKVIISFVQEITVTLKPKTVQQSVSVQGQSSSITTQSVDTASAVRQAI